MVKPPAFEAECLEQLQVGNLAGQAPITVFTCFPAHNLLAVVLQGTDAISFKQSKIKPDEVLALLTDLKESFEELHKKLRRAVLPKELEAAESVTSTSKLTSRWEIPFLLGQHSLERKPRLLLDRWDRSESWQLSLSECTQLSILRRRRDKASMPTPCASIMTHP